MKLSTWIQDTGPKEIAKKIGVDPSTVSNWRQGKAFPRPRRLMQIFALSKGKVTYAEMVHHFVGRSAR
jgi:transcriptional regulator with XRE-family HTH domain